MRNRVKYAMLKWFVEVVDRHALTSINLATSENNYLLLKCLIKDFQWHNGKIISLLPTKFSSMLTKKKEKKTER